MTDAHAPVLQRRYMGPDSDVIAWERFCGACGRRLDFVAGAFVHLDAVAERIRVLDRAAQTVVQSDYDDPIRTTRLGHRHLVDAFTP